MSQTRTDQIATVIEALFGLDTRSWMDTYQAATYLALPVRQLIDWRDQKTGPKYHKAPGGTVRYKRAHLDQWMSKHLVDTDEGAPR